MIHNYVAELSLTLTREDDYYDRNRYENYDDYMYESWGIFNSLSPQEKWIVIKTQIIPKMNREQISVYIRTRFDFNPFEVFY